MNNAATPGALTERRPTDWTSGAMQRRIRRRYAAERRFKALGMLAVLLSAAVLLFLLATMVGNGVRGFTQTEVKLPVTIAAAAGAPPATLQKLTNDAAIAAFGPDGEKLISEGAWLKMRAAATTRENGPLWVPASVDIDLAAKSTASPEAEAAYQKLSAAGAIRTSFNTTFLTGADATDPSLVGIWGAVKGSLLTMLVTLALAFPIGVSAAIYLEEYAPRNRWTDLIEVSINNLAAVPSIIFGLLGLAVFLNFFGLPRSAPLVGGLTLALMTMPVIVIAGRNAIKAVPPSIRDAALGIGASRVQVVFHHVLPLALPGILTGTIIGMSRALGETAPALMIGMRAFIAAPPGGIDDPATLLPVQIFLWSDEVSRGFVEKTSAAIIVLLVVLLAMNALAIYLRNRFEQRW